MDKRMLAGQAQKVFQGILEKVISYNVKMALKERLEPVSKREL